jgi:carbonic anhydrase
MMVKKMSCMVMALAFLLIFTYNSEGGSETPGKSKHREIHWSYKGIGGPEFWGHLKPEFVLCRKGKYQSPIDFSNNIFDADLKDITFSYKPTPLRVINNGHTIQVNYAPGSLVEIDGQEYQLLQFHFHAPSEHTVSGSHYDMEMHLVHKNSQDELAVVGVFLKKGQENKVIQTIWNNIPQEINKEKTIVTENINAADLLPSDTSYYHYYGSLTTPPCTEGVNWSVMKTPIEVSPSQVEKFKSLIKENARPTLPVNKRFVLE